MPDCVFDSKFEHSIKTTLQIVKEYSIPIKLYDLKEDKIYHNSNEAINKIQTILKQKEWLKHLDLGR